MKKPNIYKVYFLSSNKVFVYLPLTQDNSRFKHHIFDDAELQKINKDNIDIEYINDFPIFPDDSIGIVKLKLFASLQNIINPELSFSFDEMYLFGLYHEPINMSVIYQRLTITTRIY